MNQRPDRRPLPGRAFLFAALMVTAALAVLPPTAQAATATYTTDDGSQEDYVDLDQSDDSAQKTITLPAGGLPSEPAILAVYATVDSCSGTASHVLTVNSWTTTFDPCGKWTTSGYTWADFGIPASAFSVGANVFTMQDTGSGYTSSNSYVGIDTGTSDSTSSAIECSSRNPSCSPIAGALMWRLTITSEDDSDGDGVGDSSDNCPSNANPSQTDLDGDGTGDACDADVDGDGSPNASDNCPSYPNPTQADRDSDGVGDHCDPEPAVRVNSDGTITVYVDQDRDGNQDPGEPSVTTPAPSGGGGLTERSLLHEEGLVVAGSQPLPPVGSGGVPVPDVPPQPGQAVPDVPGQPGQPVPDVPGQPGQAVPDVPSTPGQPVPDHGGAGPFPTPEVGEEVGVLSTRDAGANYCVYFTPEGGPEQLLTCAGKSFLGPLDPLLPRGDTELVFYDPADVPGTGPIVTPDVPGTPPVATPNVPPTGPVATPNVPPVPGQATPDVPPTPGQATPDVPPVPVGSLGDSPEVTVDVDVSYRYDAGRITPLVNVLGQQSWSPVGPTPGDAQWLASPTNAAALTVTVTVYKDGVSQGTVSHTIPALGQVLAAAEMSAGTL